MYINHVNYANEIGNVYCCLRNKVVELNQFQIDNFCSGCKMFKGGNEGRVLCYWKDLRQISDPHIVYDPRTEYLSMQKKKLDAM